MTSTFFLFSFVIFKYPVNIFSHKNGRCVVQFQGENVADSLSFLEKASECFTAKKNTQTSEG